MTTQANPMDIAAILAQANQAQQLVQAQTPIAATTQPIESTSTKSVESTTKSGKAPVELPSQTERGKQTITDVNEALKVNATTQRRIADEGDNQLAKMLGMEATTRAQTTNYNQLQVKQTELEQKNKVAVAQATKSSASRYDKITNDEARNEQFHSLLAEQTALQGELDGMNLFQRLFVAPGVRKDLASIQNSILAQQQQRGAAASNYWNDRKINTQKQEDYTAEESSTIANDMAVAHAAMAEWDSQGKITDKIMGQLQAASGLNSIASGAMQDRMSQLIKEDNVTLGGIQASIEQSRLEQTKKMTSHTLKKANKEDIAWKELEDQFARFNAETDNESGITTIEGLAAADSDNPVIQRFNSWMSRTNLMSNQKPWTERLLRMEDGTWDTTDPVIQERDRQMKLTIESINHQIKKNNAKLTPSEYTPLLDPNDTSAKNLAAINDAVAKQFAADKNDIEDAVNQGRAQFVSLEDALANTDKAAWATEFPELDERDLAFIAEGGMTKIPTAITQRPVQTINSMISIMAQEVQDLPTNEAREKLHRQSKILAGFYKNQVGQLGQLQIMGLQNAQVFGVDNFKVGDSVDDKFEMTSASDWALRSTSAYIERVRAKKLGKASSILGQTKGL